MRTAIAAVLAAALLASTVPAGESPRPVFDGKVTTVAVFKNGYGFFRVEGTARPTGGTVEIAPLPAAALGTWWFYTRKDGVTIDQATAAQREVTVSRTPLSVEELIAANAGKEATVETEKGKYIGVLLPNRTAAVSPPGRELRAGPAGIPIAFTPQPVTSSDVELKAADGSIISIRSGDIRAVTISGGANQFGETKKEGYVTLKLKGADSGEVPIGYQFLEKGIRWMPSYRLELVDEKTAALSLQGEIVNDIQDLEGAMLHLVVGVPNFEQGELLSPLAYIAEMPKLSIFFPQPGQAGAGAYYMSNISQSMGEMRHGYDMLYAAPTPAAFAPVPEITSKDVSDLFYYTKENVTLKSGERASVTLLSANLAYRDIYKWNVIDWTQKDSRDGNEQGDERARIATLPKVDAAEHYVRLTNSSGKPLTSGPALLFSKGDVLAQDAVNYTPAGGTADVRITAAPDIKVGQTGEETGRNRNALNSYGYSYDLVMVKVSLWVKNFKKEGTHMVVTKPFFGTVTKAPEGATVSADTSALVSVNPHTKVDWEFDLDAGAEKTLVFDYSTYVRAR